MRDFDLVVIGAGVAGLTAAMHAARCGVSVAVLERMGVGGQIAAAERIENFPGFPQGAVRRRARSAVARAGRGRRCGIPPRHGREHRCRRRSVHPERCLRDAQGTRGHRRRRLLAQAAGSARRGGIRRPRRVALRLLRRPFLLRQGGVRRRRRRCRPRRGAGAGRARGPVAIIHRGATFDAQRALVERATAKRSRSSLDRR